ncbi:MAG: PAS domain-containing protein [Polyangiaceae bacterium]
MAAFDHEAFAAECPTAIAVVAGDGSLVFANRALASLLGYDLEDLESKPFSALAAGHLDLATAARRGR